MVARGTIVLDGSSKALGTSPAGIVKEKVNLRAGLVNKNLPTLDSSLAWQASIFGRGREIIIEGWFQGTQSEIELFLTFFEDWVNAPLSFQETAKYYPMHHVTNIILPATGYWNVMANDFEYEYDEETNSRIKYTLTMREGTKIGAFSALSGEE
jgi:hypothetical protein